MLGGYIYVVDDDEAVRASLSALFEANGYGSRCFSSAQEFLTAAPTLTPGCLIADIRMPGMGGLEMQQQLIGRGLSFPFIVITGHGEVPLAVQAMKAGALDFIEKPFAADTILDRTKSALTALSAAGHSDTFALAATVRLKNLSRREHEVVECLLAGLSNKSIAFELGISPRTVEIHRAHVMEKMGVRSLSELVRMGLAAGLQPRFHADQHAGDLR